MRLAEMELQAALLIVDIEGAAELEEMAADIEANYNTFLDPSSPHGQMQDHMSAMNSMMEESLPGLFGMMRRRNIGQSNSGSMSDDIDLMAMLTEQKRRREEKGELISLDELYQEELAKMQQADDLAAERQAQQDEQENQRKKSVREAAMRKLDAKTGRKRFQNSKTI